MERKNGPWTIRATTEKHRDDFLVVLEDDVLGPDGEPGRYSTVTVKPGVAILPVDRDGTVYLVRQFRYAIGAESLEVACGGVEEGETSDAAAEKELREELGIRAADWTGLGTLDLDTSLVRCRVDLYLARGLTFTATERESTEVMQTVKVPLDEAVRLVMVGAITHSGSCVLILKAARLLAAADPGA